MNQEKYGQASPPEYDLSKINVKTVIFNGDLDKSSQPKDVNGWLLKEDQSGYKASNIIQHTQFYLGHSFLRYKNMDYFKVVPMLVGLHADT